jgi:hypothetical protein
MRPTSQGKTPDWWCKADEETFFRHLTVPEEDRYLFTSAPWDGGFRWFRSSNVVCLEKYRHLRKELRVV